MEINGILSAWRKSVEACLKDINLLVPTHPKHIKGRAENAAANSEDNNYYERNANEYLSAGTIRRASTRQARTKTTNPRRATRRAGGGEGQIVFTARVNGLLKDCLVLWVGGLILLLLLVALLK